TDRARGDPCRHRRAVSGRLYPRELSARAPADLADRRHRVTERPVKRWLAAATAALLLAAGGSSLTQEDFQYLKARYGIGPNSAVITELTPNEVNALHSAIDDLKTYPAGRDRAVQSYLTLVYARE